MKPLLCMLFLAAALIVLAGCSDSPILAPQSTVASSPIETPGISLVATPVLSVRPTFPSVSDKSLGGATGRFILESTGEPLGGFAIYLGERLPLSPGDQYAITIQQNSSPHVEIDLSGYFAFTDVKPGTYALVLWTPIKSQVIANPKDPTKELEVVITAGQIVDLGDVVSNLPQ